MATSPFKLIPYLLRTVDVGVRATFITLAALALLLVLPRDLEVEVVPYVIVLVIAAVGVIGITLLPWQRLFDQGTGMKVLYLWSAFDIVLITLLISMTGGPSSPLFLLYALTTVFFAASYPPRAQLFLLLFTYACYILAVSVDHRPADVAVVVTLLGILGVITFISSFLSRELLRSEMTIVRLEEAERRHDQAIEINDNIVQGLVVAKYALETDDPERARAAVQRTLEAASELVSDLAGDRFRSIDPGDLVRSRAAGE
ncbi:MAG: hypothetical protein ACRDKB_04805 [Actinomycetota bacterium]